MKKMIVFMLCIGSLTGVAQRKAGNWLAGGGLEFSSTKTEQGANNTVKDNRFSVVPNIGYFVGDNLAVGLNLSTTVSNSESGNTTVSSRTVSAGPIARYYLEVANSSLTFFGQAGIFIGSGTTTTEVGPISNETSRSSFSVGITPGLAYFFNEHWAAELYLGGIGYSSVDPNKDVNADKSSSFSFGLNSLAPTGLGVRYHF